MLSVHRKRRASSFSLRILAYCAQVIRRTHGAGLNSFTSAIEGIKINSINLEQRGNRLVWVKRRQLGSGVIALFANLFFLLARARLHLALIESYNEPEVLAEVRRRLTAPRGWSGIWSKLRTDYLRSGVMTDRIETLNAALSVDFASCGPLSK